MTLFEIIFSIPGIIAMTLIGPYIFLAALELLFAIIKAPFQIINEIALAVQKEKPQRQPIPQGSNVIELDTMAALAYIKNHEAMQFVAKG